MPKKLTQKEWVSKASKIHKNKYNYEKTLYKKSSLKVVINCPKHGDFEQLASSHLQGSGCPICWSIKRIGITGSDTETFIKKSKEIHNNKYDYTKTIYNKALEKVIITCSEHGDFEQRPSHHLRKHGCPNCGDVIKHTLEVFIENSKEVHNNIYDYSKVIYVNNNTKVIIGCPIHGDFEQAPSNHTTQKQGCLDCAGNRKHTTTSFSNKANKVHNSKYDYSKTVYKSGKTKVTIICRIHGDFKITPNSHLRGVGCSSCAIRGFNRSRFSDISEFATLYIIHCFNDNESFYKIGITTKTVNKRFNKINMPYDYEVLTSLKTLSGLAFDLEKSLHNYLGEYKYKPNIKFNGSSECFLMTKTKLDEIINIIEYREKRDAS